MNIEDQHKKNLCNVEDYGLKVGQTWKHKHTGKECVIKHIHSLYGWVTTEPYGINQDMRNINEWEQVL